MIFLLFVYILLWLRGGLRGCFPSRPEEGGGRGRGREKGVIFKIFFYFFYFYFLLFFFIFYISFFLPEQQHHKDHLGLEGVVHLQELTALFFLLRQSLM